ncbi:MAG: ABC transporter permease subunit [Pseudomonadota bacterium]
MSLTDPLRLGAIAVSLSILVLAVIGPEITPHDPLRPDPLIRLAPPSAEHWFGTDHLGRDVFSRVLAGARLSVGLAILVVIVSAAIGLVIGLIAGMGGRWLDAALMRITDAFFAFPELVAALAVAGVLGGGGTEVLFALAVVGWMRYARVVRAMTLTTAATDHVALARLSGVRPVRIALDHLMPPVLPAMVVIMTAHVARAILAISGLGFLGFGASPPQPEWGVILLEARTYILSAPAYALLPGIPIVVSALAFNLAGDTLRDRVGLAGPA